MREKSFYHIYKAGVISSSVISFFTQAKYVFKVIIVGHPKFIILR